MGGMVGLSFKAPEEKSNKRTGAVVGQAGNAARAQISDIEKKIAGMGKDRKQHVGPAAHFRPWKNEWW